MIAGNSCMIAGSIYTFINYFYSFLPSNPTPTYRHPLYPSYLFSCPNPCGDLPTYIHDPPAWPNCPYLPT